MSKQQKHCSFRGLDKAPSAQAKAAAKAKTPCGKSVQQLMKEQCACAAKESCKNCERCVNGVQGHHPWDELEMLRHGWADQHGNHWAGAGANEDEVEMLHQGLVTPAGLHHTKGKHSKKETRPPNHLGEKGHVKFASPVDVRMAVFDPAAQANLLVKQ